MGNKIDAMYHFYGIGSGKCGNCPHCIKKEWDRTYYKCLVYGDSNSERTDWRSGWRACGLIDKPFPEEDKRIVYIWQYYKTKAEEQIEGQIVMEGI